MKQKKRKLKSVLKTGVINGLVFATGMALLNFYDKEPFSIIQFLFYFIFFGGCMAYTFRNVYSKNE